MRVKLNSGLYKQERIYKIPGRAPTRRRKREHPSAALGTRAPALQGRLEAGATVCPT